MRRLSCSLFVGTAVASFASCGAPQEEAPPPPVEEHDTAGAQVEDTGGVSEQQAIQIATDTGADGGYDMSVYQFKSAELQDDGSGWWVHFEHAPPTPPGGHFAVEVHAETGEARLIHGE